ncbi:MAG TPA: hypothetical protein VF885_21555 [Arthrobacter sp.]
MAITSIGYDGSVNEAQWSKLIPLAGSSHYGVAAGPDWKVTPHATLDRGVSIATGSGWGNGILDTSDTTVSLQGTVVSSGSRWDLVVARRNWGGAGGLTTFVLVPGSSSKSLPARNTTPGTLDDQPLALVQFTAGQSAPTSVVDLRCWARNGGMTARDELALTYLKMPGAQLMINGTQWNCEVDANGNPSWTTFVSGRVPLFGASTGALGQDNINGAEGLRPQDLVNAGQQFMIQAGTNVNYSDHAGYARLTFQKPFPNGLLTVLAFNGDDWATGGSMMFASAGGVNGGGTFGSDGFGNRFNWVYSVLGQPAAYLGGSSLQMQRIPNKIHRINWIAIGW